MPQFQSNLDLNRNELRNARIQNLSTAPTGPVEGQVYYDTALKALYVFDGTAWELSSLGTGSISNSLLADGAVTSAKIADGTIVNDDISASAAIALSKLATDPLARSNHTGTQLSSTISDFGSAVSGTSVAGDLTGTVGNAQIAAGAIADAEVAANAAISLSKLATNPLARANHSGTQAASTINFAATDRLLGRDTTGSGTGEEITVTGGVEFSGSGGIQTSAFTGDVTKAAGGTVLTIASNAVTTAKIADSNVTTAKVADNAVTNAKLADMATSTIKGRVTASTGDPEDLTAAQVKTLLALTSADISNFDTQVRTSRLDQMAAPTAVVSLNSQRITNLAAPTSDNDAATKLYVDEAVAGLAWKEAVRVATTTNITLSGAQTIDGVSVVAGDRVLVKNQSTASANGIYVASAGSWSRSSDANSAEDVRGLAVLALEGSTQAGTQWITTASGTITLGTTNLDFTQFGGTITYSAGSGLTLSGSTFNIGAGTGITVNADDVAINTSVVARKFTTTIGDGINNAYTVTHNLGNQWVNVDIVRNSSPFDIIIADIELTNTTQLTVRFASAPTSNQFRVIVSG